MTFSIAIRMLSLLTLCGLSLAPLGCTRGPSQQDEARVEIPLIASGTPEEAARSLVAVMRCELKAVAAEDRASAARARELLRELAAQAEIEARFEKRPEYKAIVKKDLVGSVIDRWSAASAYYADTLEPAAAYIPAQASGADRTFVLVPIRAQRPLALRVECVRKQEGQWRVARIDFEPLSPVSTQPTPAVPDAAAASQPT